MGAPLGAQGRVSDPIMPTTPEQVADAFRRTGSGWILDDPQRDRILAGVAREIDEFVASYRQRFHDTPQPFDLVERNVTKATAFFQAFVGPPHSIEVRMMIWRVLVGADIVSVRFDYTRGAPPQLAIVTATPYGERDEFRSDNLWDFRVMRHIGILGVDGQAILDGYYALRHA